MRPRNRPRARTMGAPHNNDGRATPKTATRLSLRLTWELAQLGGPLTAEQARTVAIMREHPEYADLWPRLDRMSDAAIERDGSNPIVHITMHGIVENQIAAGKPADVANVVAALVEAGLPRHEVIHRVTSVLSKEIFHVMRDKRSFDEARYVRKLLELVGASHGD